MKWLSREWLSALAMQVFGLLAMFGVIVPDDLATQITGAVVAVAGLVAWIVGRTAQKKNGV